MFTNPYYNKLKKHRCLILLVIYISFFCFEPIVFNYPSFDTYVMITFYLLAIFSPAIIIFNKKYFIIIIALITISLASYTIYYYSSVKIFLNISYCFSSLTDIQAIVVLIIYIMGKKIKSRDDLYASIIVFLLIGGTFGDIFYLIYKLNPHSICFTYSGSGFIQTASNNIVIVATEYRDFLYFSFSTLTTLGYGDVIPVSATARRLACMEACIGVLYIALFIGRIVGSSITDTDFKNSIIKGKEE